MAHVQQYNTNTKWNLNLFALDINGNLCKQIHIMMIIILFNDVAMFCVNISQNVS